MSHRFLQVLTCCLTCSLFFTGCSAPFQHGDGDGSGYLFTAYLSENPKNLDPQSATDAASKTVITNLFEGLLEQDITAVFFIREDRPQVGGCPFRHSCRILESACFQGFLDIAQRLTG